MGAARYGNNKIVRKLLKVEADATARDNTGRTALHLAIQKGKSQLEDVVRLLLNTDVDIEAKDKDGATALHVAASQNQARVLELLINKKALVSVKDIKGKTPLGYASRANSKNIIKLLLKHGATCEPDLDNRTELHEAIEGGCDVEIVKLFLSKGVDVRAKSNKRETALELAALRNDKNAVEIVQLLLESDAELNTRNSFGKSILHYAAQGGSFCVTQLFLTKNIDIESKDQNGSTPLADACFSASEEVVRLLLEHGADTKVVDDNGWTMLHFAAFGMSKAIIEMIFDHAQGAIDIIAKNNDGRTALDIASQSGEYSVVHALLARNIGKQPELEGEDTPLHLVARADYRPKQLALVESLLEAGFDINTKNAQGNTPLQNAILKGCEKETIIQALLDNQTCIENKNNYGDTALHCLAKSSHQCENILAMLLEKKANVHALNNNGCTPLFFMVTGNNPTSVQLLLEHGADVSAKSQRDNSTPLQWAARRGTEAVIRVLLDFDADVNVDGLPCYNALHAAARYNTLSAVQLLVEYGAKITKKCSFPPRETPLHFASARQETKQAQFLIDHGADVHAITDDGCSPLHIAAYFGFPTTDILLQNGAEIDKKSKMGKTALHLACQKDQFETVKILVEKGASTLTADDYGQTPLHLAAQANNEDIGLCLLSAKQTTKVDIRTESGFTPLILAAQNGKLQVVRALLARNDCTPFLVSKIGRDALSYAAENGHESVVKELLKIKSVVTNASDQFKMSALHYACQEDHRKIAEELLKMNASNINSQDKYGYTPLIRACLLRSEDVVEMLLDRDDVDLNIIHILGTTALIEAVAYDYWEIMSMLLQKNNIDIKIRTKSGRTALAYACFRGAGDIYDQLPAMQGAEVILPDGPPLYQAPLHYAVEVGHATMIKLLLDREGVEADVRGAYNRSPLWYAATAGAEEIVSILLEQNVEIDALDEDNRTPLHQAVEHGHMDVVKLLLEHGANAELDVALEIALHERHKDIASLLRTAGATEIDDWYGLEKLF